MENIEFTYLYRDGSNYKKWGSVVFSNSDSLGSESVEERLRQTFLPDGLFIASQIRIPDVFLYIGGEVTCDDHCYHEFGGIQSTPSPADDAHGRSISEFLIEVTREGEGGWQAFDPCDREGSLNFYPTSRARS